MFVEFGDRNSVTLKAAQESGPTIAYGLFISNFIYYLSIIGIALFVAKRFIKK